MELMRYADTSEASSAAQRRNVAVRTPLPPSPNEYQSPDLTSSLLASWHDRFSSITLLWTSMMIVQMTRLSLAKLVVAVACTFF